MENNWEDMLSSPDNTIFLVSESEMKTHKGSGISLLTQRSVSNLRQGGCDNYGKISSVCGICTSEQHAASVISYLIYSWYTRNKK